MSKSIAEVILDIRECPCAKCGKPHKPSLFFAGRKSKCPQCRRALTANKKRKLPAARAAGLQARGAGDD